MACSENGRLSRRNFLAAAGVAGGALAASHVKLFAQEAKTAATQPAGYAMLPFGKTGLKVSLVGFGAIRIGPPVGQRLLKMAVDSGVNTVHTARGYGSGKSVQSIGMFLKESPEYRKKIVLCLKEDSRVKEASLDADLKNLNTDYVDVYLPQLQRPEQGVMEDAIAAMETLKKKGKIRFGGFTCHEDMLGVCQLVLDKAPKAYDATLISTAMVRPRDGKPGTDETATKFIGYLKQLKANGVGIISMKSGASKVIDQGAPEYGSHMRVLAEAGVDTCITSFASVKHIETAMAAGLGDLKVTARDVATWERQWQASGWPCMMCGACTGACPAGLPVASLMRFVMYRDHYHMARHAKQEFAEMGIKPAVAMASCAGCNSCSGACPVGLASSSKVREIVGTLA